jgi:hypothetical protein
MFVDMEVNTCKAQNSTNSELIILTEVNFFIAYKVNRPKNSSDLARVHFSTKKIVNLALVQTEL